MTAFLKSTIFDWTYSTFGVENDLDLVTSLSHFFLAATIFNFCVNCFTPFPAYGKFRSKTVPWWNIQLEDRIGWTVALFPPLVIPVVVLFATGRHALWNVPNLIAISIYIIHYINRTLVYCWGQLTQKRQTDLWFTIMVFIMSIIPSFGQSHHLINVHHSTVSAYTVVGSLIAFAGFYINKKCDTELVNLRRKSDRYQVLRGGLFELVACPNFMGEVMEWWGLFIITREYPQLVYALWSTVFLTWRSYYAHDYYRKTFGNKYPNTRKIIIPYIF